MGKKSISYTGVVLNFKSRSKLVRKFSKLIPDDWEVIADHMTINLGSIKPEYQEYLGFNIRLDVVSIGYDKNVIALGVEGFDSDNDVPHITLAINPNGGRPEMSKFLNKWKKIKLNFSLVGTVTEVEQKF